MKNDVTHLNELYYTYEEVYVTHMKKSMLHVGKSHATHIKVSCYTNDEVVSHK